MRHLAQDLCRLHCVSMLGKIRQADNPDEFSADVRAKNPGLLVFPHQPLGDRDCLVRAARDQVASHHILGSRLVWIETLTDDPNYQVAICDRPDSTSKVV